MWCWLGLLLSEVCRMGWVFQSIWEYTFCSNLRSPGSAAKPFWIWRISVYLGSSEFVRLWRYSLGWNGSTLEFNLSDSKVELFDCQFQSCLANAFEDCPNVPGKIRSVIGCNSNVIHVLSTLVSLDNWDQVLAHETWESRQRSAETLCKSFVGKCSASKIEYMHIHRTLVRHLQAMISVRAVKFKE